MLMAEYGGRRSNPSLSSQTCAVYQRNQMVHLEFVCRRNGKAETLFEECQITRSRVGWIRIVGTDIAVFQLGDSPSDR